MRRIVSVIRPFDLKQKSYVFEDGNKIQIEEYELNNLPTELLKLAKEFNVQQIDLSGPKHFSKKIKTDIEKNNVKDYSINELMINII